MFSYHLPFPRCWAHLLSAYTTRKDTSQYCNQASFFGKSVQLCRSASDLPAVQLDGYYDDRSCFADTLVKAHAVSSRLFWNHLLWHVQKSVMHLQKVAPEMLLGDVQWSQTDPKGQSMWPFFDWKCSFWKTFKISGSPSSLWAHFIQDIGESAVSKLSFRIAFGCWSYCLLRQATAIPGSTIPRALHYSSPEWVSIWLQVLTHRCGI